MRCGAWRGFRKLRYIVRKKNDFPIPSVSCVPPRISPKKGTAHKSTVYALLTLYILRIRCRTISAACVTCRLRRHVTRLSNGTESTSPKSALVSWITLLYVELEGRLPLHEKSADDRGTTGQLHARESRCVSITCLFIKGVGNTALTRLGGCIGVCGGSLTARMRHLSQKKHVGSVTSAVRTCATHG